MKIELWVIGKTNEKYLETGIAVFEKRLKPAFQQNSNSLIAIVKFGRIGL